MKRIIVVSLLCLTLIFGIFSFTMTETPKDHLVILDALPRLGEKTDNLPYFVKVNQPDDEPYSSFQGEYAGILIRGQAWEERLCSLDIEPPRSLEAKKIDEIAGILKSKYGPPTVTTKKFYAWEKHGLTLRLSRAQTLKELAGTITGYTDDMQKATKYKDKPKVTGPVWPVGGKGGTDLKNFPKYSWGKNHSGTDIVAPAGTPVFASYSGVVVVSTDIKDAKGNYVDYGKLITIKSKVNGKTVHIFYAHLSERMAAQNTHVTAGEMIGKVGTTGQSDGNHLHYEVREGIKILNPHDYLPKR